MLAEAGGKVNADNQLKCKPLHLAVRHLEAVELLLDLGADVQVILMMCLGI